MQLQIQNIGKRGIWSFILICAVGVITCWNQALAQGPVPVALLPTLSLTGADQSFKDDVYSDGRIWVGYGDVKEREMLLPVFVQNLFEHDSSLVTISRYTGFPIRSFEFSISYDGRALIATGVQHTGVEEVTPNNLAKEFTYEWDDKSDSNRYRVYLTGQTDPETKFGRRVTIIGTSTHKLPVMRQEDGYVVLCYVKFRVRLTRQQLISNPQVFQGADQSPIYINNDSIFYNRFQVGKDNPFPTQDDGDPSNPYGNKSYRRDRTPTIGLAGIDISNTVFPEYPSRRGLIWLKITADPLIGFQDAVGGTNNEVRQDINTPDGSLWELTRPIVLDSAIVAGVSGTRDVQLLNVTARSRLTKVRVESDQPWLAFQTLSTGFNPIPSNSRSAVIEYIDNGINGPVPPNLLDAAGQQRDGQANIRFRIVCSQNVLQQQGEYAGIYQGTITVTSKSAGISPVRLRVKFIYFRNPKEPGRRPAAGRNFGVTMRVQNSSGTVGDFADLVFGTGHRATDGSDSLFGEIPQQFPATGFNARWYTPWVTVGGFEAAPYGLGDIPIESFGNIRTRSVSRDVRNNAVDTTLVYLCRFNAGGASNYPIVLSWDIQDFPDGAQFFLRDTLNGSGFSVDMREGTRDPNSPTARSFTIRDARWVSFIIEYTLPRVEKFPVIVKGWNFLSLPVRPSDNRVERVFPNSIPKTTASFSSNRYRFEDFVYPGYGYFVNYGDYLDSLISGTSISGFDGNPLTPALEVRLFPGWNTIGAASTPVNVKDIDFDPFQTDLPQRQGGVYGYRTNRGYYETSELTPGLGYWIKVTNNGYLKYTAPARGAKYVGLAENDRTDAIDNSAVISISDAEEKSANLYLNSLVNASEFEMPPLPYTDMFDVRFSTNNYVENTANNVIMLQGVEYPATVRIDNTDNTYQLFDAETGAELGTISGSNDKVVVVNPEVTKIRLVEYVVTAGQSGVTVNPNPANGVATIAFDAPTGSSEFTSVKLYNMLGVEVMTIAEGIFTTAQSREIGIQALPQGQYFVKVISNNSIKTTVLNIVR